MSTKYVMPKVRIGDAVVWAHSASRLDDGAPGFVTKVGTEAIGLVFFPPDTRNASHRDGVRFHADPANNRIESDAGVFDFGADRKRLDALVARLDSLEDELAGDGK